MTPTNGNDTIFGTSNDDNINALAGDDYLYDGYGDDTLNGGDGNDAVIGSWGNDKLYGGNGNDTLGFESYHDEIGDDYLDGGNGNDEIYAGTGNDTVTGGGGDDLLDGGAGIDTVDYRYWSGGGTYNLASEIASFAGFYDEEIRNFENIETGNGNDIVTGTVGNNNIETGGGDDTLMGIWGNDTLTGGDGADDFKFDSEYQGVDTITDFSWGENDEIFVSRNGFGGGLTEGFLQPAQFTIGSSASDSSDRIIYDYDTGDLFFDIDGTGGASQVQFASLDSSLKLIASDFVVF